MTPPRQGKKLEKLVPPPGEIGCERLMELLAASFDWDPSLRDPKAVAEAFEKKSVRVKHMKTDYRYTP